jgi:hypothetical protein
LTFPLDGDYFRALGHHPHHDHRHPSSSSNSMGSTRNVEPELEDSEKITRERMQNRQDQVDGMMNKVK